MAKPKTMWARIIKDQLGAASACDRAAEYETNQDRYESAEYWQATAAQHRLLAKAMARQVKQETG